MPNLTLTFITRMCFSCLLFIYLFNIIYPYGLGGDNFLTCPIGILFTLGILLGSGGAQGRTGYQIGKTMRLKSTSSSWNSSEAQQEMKSLYQELNNSLTSEKTFLNEKEENVVRISTGIFVQKTYEVERRFNESIANDFEGELKQASHYILCKF